jgi:short-subunit dehydrogenase
MVARQRGGILNVGSIAAFQAGPCLAVYSATKAYVQSFTEALAEELKGTGVTATCLAPGPTKTNFQIKARMEDAIFFRLVGMEVQPVARAGYDAFRKGRVFVIPGMLNRLAIVGSKLAPRFLSRKVAGLANH